MAGRGNMVVGAIVGRRLPVQGPLCVVGMQELASEWIALGFENWFAFFRMDVAA